VGKINLVLGGTKSGKTSWAQEKARALSAARALPVAYIATALPFDEGMKLRITKHRASRPTGWITFEEPLHVSRILEEAARGASAVILDCLTVLATNILMELGEEPDREEAQGKVLAEVEAILQAANKVDGELIIVSNLVEEGLIAPTRLGGIFQDIAGLSHQKIAARADRVVHMIAGIPRFLKGEA
jgi:adenosylcobinamide kinase / adenosylcobinamide-phosphate guanylyltransferase